jgi:hypothetical protein
VTEPYENLLAWIEAGIQDGWVSEQLREDLVRMEQQQAEALFGNHPHRPLIIGLFGGTGVGKSSLLNRLAGEEIARTGIERPTSLEVTFYLHQAFNIDLLPEELPLRQTRLAYHADPSRRLLAWLDMPDMDSTEPRNRQLVEAWMPYLDWVVYVVTPERYHDEQGWRYLEQRRHRHAWLFVLNHWDQGRPQQLEDFRKRLKDAGFPDAVVLRTSCLSTPQEDDFPLLEQTIQKALQHYGSDLLQKLGLQAQYDDLLDYVERCREAVGDEQAWGQLYDLWKPAISDHTTDLSGRMREHVALIINGLTSAANDPNQLTQQFEHYGQRLWSDRERDRIDLLNSQLLSLCQANGLPFAPVKATIERLLGSMDQEIHMTLEKELEGSLAHPGHPIQRFLFKAMALLMSLLPLAAAAWVGQHLLSRFYQGTQGSESFLGIDFAIHSAMIIALAWLLPWFLHRQLRPSVRTIVKRGANRGIGLMAHLIKEGYEGVWQEVQKTRRTRLLKLDAIAAEIGSQEQPKLTETAFTVRKSHLDP